MFSPTPLVVQNVRNLAPCAAPECPSVTGNGWEGLDGEGDGVGGRGGEGREGGRKGRGKGPCRVVVVGSLCFLLGAFGGRGWRRNSYINGIGLQQRFAEEKEEEEGQEKEEVEKERGGRSRGRKREEEDGGR